MPLPSRPAQPNRNLSDVPANAPKLGDLPTTAPAGLEQRNEAPRLAATSNDAPQNSFAVPAFKNPLQSRNDEEEYVAEELPTPVVEDAPEAPKNVLPTRPTQAAESAAETRTEPAEATPTVTAAPTVTPEPVAASVPVEQPEQTVATKDLDDNVDVENLPWSVRNSIARLFEYLLDDSSSEVLLNGPNKVGFVKDGQRYFDTEIDFGDISTYHYVLNKFLLPLSNTADRIGVSKFLIEGQLEIPDEENPARPPMIARLHIIAPPTVKAAIVTVAKKAREQFTIDALVQRNSLSAEMGEFLKFAAKGRLTVVFSGLSGSGKTTLLQAMSREFDVNDRVVLIEDIEELAINVTDIAPMTSSQNKPGEDPRNIVTLDWLVRQANRMRPDRIIVGEIRGPEMSEFLVAANSGADGSMTTLHADDPQATIRKMADLTSAASSNRTEASIYRSIASTVQLIVQMTKIDGKHKVTHIEEVSNQVVGGNSVATNTIFSYNRNKDTFEVVGRPSDELTAFLSQRGIHLPNYNNRQNQFGRF